MVRKHNRDRAEPEGSAFATTPDSADLFVVESCGTSGLLLTHPLAAVVRLAAVALHQRVSTPNAPSLVVQSITAGLSRLRHTNIHDDVTHRNESVLVLSEDLVKKSAMLSRVYIDVCTRAREEVAPSNVLPPHRPGSSPAGAKGWP